MSSNTDEVRSFPDLRADIDDVKEVVRTAKELVAELRVSWDLKDLKEKIFTDGITNVLVGIYVEGNKDDAVLVRFYGHNTEEIVDRDAEIRNMKLLHSAGRGPALLATFANGIAYEFVAGDMVSKETVVDSNISQMIIEMMAVMHSLDMSGADGKPCLWDRMRKFHAASPDGFMNDPAKEEHYRKAALPSKLELAREIELMEKELGDVQSPIVFCHNDLLLGNIVINKDGRGVTFIDYEYGEANYQAFDIADHFTEFVGVDVELDYDKHYPNEDFQKDWLRRYLSAYNDKAPSDKEVHELYVLVNKFALCANLKWGLWALAQAKSSTIDFDFILYAKQRLNEYKKKKEAFLAMN